MSAYSIKAGKTIYSPFTDTARVFVIESGYVLAYTYEDSGKRRIHLMYGPGSYFPVITTFKNTEQRATYESLTTTEIQEYTRENFMKRVDTDQVFCRDILRKTVEQLTIFADRVMDLQLTRLEDRLVMRVHNLVEAHGERQDSRIRLPYILKHHHLADMLGVERESVSRVLARLKAEHKLFQDEMGHFYIPA